jgi:hypothetical protein
MSLVARYRSFDASRLHGMVIREPLIQEYRTEEGKAVLLLDRALFQARMQQLFASRTPGAPLRRRCPDVDAALHWKSATPHH